MKSPPRFRAFGYRSAIHQQSKKYRKNNRYFSYFCSLKISRKKTYNMKPILKKTLIHGGIIFFFFLVAAIYMAPAFDGKVIQQGDIQQWKAMANEQLDFHKKTGEYTTWTSSMFSGMPSYQVSTPPSKSIFTKIESWLGLGMFELSGNVGIIFIYLLGFYSALLAFGLSPWLSLLGALAFGLGSYNIIIIEAGHASKAYAMSMPI